MSTDTVGGFLLSKMQNMAMWLSKELDEPFDTSLLTETKAVYVASLLTKQITVHRDWQGLFTLQEMPSEMQRIFMKIKSREDLHDKFWRYLDLFVTLFSNE